MICDRDCLHCVFEDCIVPDDWEPTADEIRQSEQTDRDAWRYNCEADYDGEAAKRKRISDSKRRYYLEHRAECLAYQKAYSDGHKTERSQRNRAYYEANKNRINARRQDLRRKNKLAKQAKKSKNNSESEE